jgi:type I restriction-modification system DNA methylase subunit
MILVEMKSKGKSLDKAHAQAKDYMHGLKEYELPKFILVSDFDRFRLYDLEENKTIEFKLDELYKHVQHFGYLLGYQKRVYKEQDPANIKAAELMGKLHDRLEEIGYAGHPLEVYLVRILFCLFAEDTTIFNKQQFQDYIEQRTNLDGSDLAPKLQQLFQVLNTPKESRYKNLDQQLADFPYVNGKLFEETLPVASFDRKMREALLDCCYIDWSKISPAIFGSMFQSVMNPEERRNLGAHYTSEKNILKLIKPLFLDDLRAEFESIKDNKNKLPEFHRKLGDLKFLDPACGCGNFLVITYRELRLLEFDVLKALVKSGQKFLDISQILWVEVDQFAGIEFEEFPARIAEVAMWLIDHQMNLMVSNEFGQYFVRLPLKKSAKIVYADALDVNWENIFSKEELSYIIGNPPFIGSKLMKQSQRDQIVQLFDQADGSGTLDYVSGWYLKAAKFIQGTSVKVAFVSTNSIVQGEQVSILWGCMLNRYQVSIHFAHRTFKWSNEAKGNAAVYCVIIGFSVSDSGKKVIYEYEDINSEPHEIKARNINPYLVDAKNIVIGKRKMSICNVPELSFGSMPNDGGNFLFSDSEKNDFVEKDPRTEKYFRPLVSAHEFLNGQNRWCLWLKDALPSDLNSISHIKERIENVRKHRSSSTRKGTIKLAEFPSLFGEDRQPSSDFVLIPRHSSENRKYIPMGIFDPSHIASDSCLFIENAGLYHFGILMSAMHMTWVRNICGRLKSDYRYSKDIVYNNYPWPESPEPIQIERIERAAKHVLDVRLDFPTSSLADLYHPLTMPPALIKAHKDLDKAVDSVYRSQPFVNEANRLVFLFELYEKYTADLFTDVKVKKKKHEL